MTQKATNLELTTIAAVSPSLAELLRLCALRAGLSRLVDAAPLALGNPKAWLGTAYHDVLEAAGAIVGGGFEATIAASWDRAIQRLYGQAQAHPLNSRFGPPERWPGYQLTRAMALMRASEIAVGAAATVGAEGKPATNIGSASVGGREGWLTAADGRLVGRPDVVSGDAIIDFKTGSVYEYGDDDVVKASYVRQLQFYAYLVKKCIGRWPVRGVLLPMDGAPVEINLEPKECERTTQEALELLEAYNDHVEAGGTAVGLANPSPDACRWCPHQLVCPAFWVAADESWSEHGGGGALGGAATAAPQPIHSGAALTLTVRADEGTGPRQIVNLAPLSPETHPAVQLVQAGTRVRVVSIHRRADGTVMPNIRTVMARTADLPNISIAESQPDGLTV